MAVNLSPIWGAGAQLLDNSGNVLTGGKIYTYAAGTTTPATTYTSSSGATANSNPIILNSAGRVPYEIWLTDGVAYKYVLKDSSDTLIATYDNLTGINSNFIAYTAKQEIQTATAGQTVFILTTMQYQPGNHNLAVYVDGVNQYGPGAMYAYVETSSDTVTFVNGLHVGASVKFTTATPVSSSGQVFSVSLQDYGANGNGITDTTAAIEAAETNVPVFAQQGTYVTTIANPVALYGRQWGIGQIKTADGNKSAPNFAIVDGAPSSEGNHSSILTAFNGDISRIQVPISHAILGAATAGTPTTGYKYTPEIYPNYTYLYNNSGWNESTSDNDGRTAVCAYRTSVNQYGQGDAVAYNATAFVTGAKTGATSYLANPAAVLFNGGCFAGHDGVLLGPSEYVLQDQGYDVAGVGFVMTMNRTNNTGALDCFWAGYRSQGVGTKDIDQAFGAQGKHYIGVDLGIADISGSAMTMKANTKIHFNSTAADYRKTSSLGGSWMRYNGSVGEIQWAGQDAVQFAVGNTASAVNYVKANGAPTGGAPQFRAIGSDTDISIGYSTKGAGYHFFFSNNATAVEFAVSGNATSAVNYATAFGAATGSGCGFTAAGSDTNIDIKLNAKGSGVVDFGTQTSGSAGGASGYMVIKVSGNSYKVPLYAV